MATKTSLRITAGLPFSQRYRVPAAGHAWTLRNQFEVRCQVRDTARTLLTDLTPFLSVALDGARDVVIDLVMTGEQTRTVKAGNYDIVVSDVGTVDARAIRILFGSASIAELVTAAV